MGWVSPTAWLTPEGGWMGHGNTHDDDTGTRALNLPMNWNKWLQLKKTYIFCTKLRIYANDFATPNDYDPDITVEMMFDGGNVEVYDGTITKLTWVEIEFDGGETSYGMRIKSNTSARALYVHEVDFWQRHAVPFLNGGLVNTGLRKGLVT